MLEEKITEEEIITEYTDELLVRLNKHFDNSDFGSDFGFNDLYVKKIINNFNNLEENIASIKETLEVFYPDFWEFTIANTDNTKLTFQTLINICDSWARNSTTYRITIHFPELLVKSQDGKKQTVKDLFVQIPLRYDLSGVASKYIQGLRTTYTLAEVDSNYKFSHLAGECKNTNASSWDNFCLGDTGYASTAGFLKDSFDKEQFYMFIQQLTNYLSWESIAGTPYRYIRNIKEGEEYSSNQERYPSNDEADTIISEYLSIDNILPPVEIVSNSQHYKLNVVSTNDFMLDIGRVCEVLDRGTGSTYYTDRFTSDFNAVEQKRIKNDTKGRQDRIDRWIKGLKNYTFTFKDKVFNFIITDGKDAEQTISEKNKNQVLIANFNAAIAITQRLNIILNDN